MKEKKYSLAKAISWYTTGNILIKAINFLTLRLFTTLMNTGDYGVFGLFQSYLSIFEIAILLGTAHTIKMVKYDKSIRYDQYISSILFIPIIGAGICVVVLSIYSIYSTVLADLHISIWYSIIITSCFLAIINIISSKLILEGDYKSFILYSFVNSISNIVVSLLLCYTIFYNSQTYWARIYGGMISGIISLIYLLTRIKLEKPRVSYIKSGISMGMPLFVHAIATQVLVQSDKIIINKISSLSEVGIYSVATTISVIPTTLLSSIESSWSPWYFKQLDEKNYTEIKKKNNLILIGFALMIVLFILSSPEIVKIITTKEYWNSVYILIPLSISTFAELIYLIPLNMELYYKKNNAIWVYTISVVIFNIVVDIMGIKKFGYLAAAYVTCISRFLLFFMHYIRCKKIDSNSVLSIKVILLSLLALSISTMTSIMFIDKFIIRWILIIVIIITIACVAIRGKNRKYATKCE